VAMVVVAVAAVVAVATLMIHAGEGVGVGVDKHVRMTKLWCKSILGIQCGHCMNLT